jgi:nucleotide-binding universal stress UspA family protein
MLKVLVPVDGSDNALRALRHVASIESTCREAGEIYVLNVQPPVASGVVRMFLTPGNLKGYYEEEAEKVLAVAREELSKVVVPFTAEMRVGEMGETIARYAREKGCGLIAMGTRGLSSVGNLLLGSVTTKVINLTDVPVLLVK